MASEQPTATQSSFDEHGSQQQQQASLTESSSNHPSQTKMSNLTKHLMSSSTNNSLSSGSPSSSMPPPPSYTSISSPRNFADNDNPLPGPSTQFASFPGHLQGSSNPSGTSAYFQQRHSYSNPQQQGPVSVPVPSNFIPSTHNTPTMVNSSYSSNHSFTPHSGNHFQQYQHPPPQQHNLQQQQQQHQQFSTGSYKPMTLSQGVPTTNLSMHSANPGPSSVSAATFYQNPVSGNQPRFASSFPNSGGFNSDSNAFNHLNRIPTYQDQSPLGNVHHAANDNISGGVAGTGTGSTPSVSNMSVGSGSGSKSGARSGTDSVSGSSGQAPEFYSFTEPDHYMTYKEFLESLNAKDAEASETASRQSGTAPIQPEEHLNITEYSINDLIMMLSCLLTKIVEANDKLHPNHFDNTIAVRQKTKEEKRIRKLNRQKLKRESDEREHGESFKDESFIDEDDDSEDEEDDDDEMKNKYLANVLAFHGKNIPGISLHAYLTRVLKYCPVTSDVFLSLLVYFDRIAKKANNLKRSRNKDGEENDDGTSEQLFVMDSYNIHRLIISGITVSSKFFSDIFYKNLRYAKVGGLPLEELNYLELQFLLLLDFKLMISVEDLQNYGDLLLRFWKREQVTNELVHGGNPGNFEQAQQQPPPPTQSDDSQNQSTFLRSD
ncbi:hypothetical protein CAAN1_05S04962 [[Candida] anglica]|uniref:Cyclin n=1 Tax=[Candida] anglica TaxID=148631 RepID=A0ABP0EHM7_9ASCO